jgi:hypothetical protein
MSLNHAAAQIFPMPERRLSELANTRFVSVHTLNVKSQFSGYSLNELRAVQDILSEFVAYRRVHRPDIGDNASFMHKGVLYTGSIVYTGKRTATIYVESLRKRLRVPYSDIKPARRNS